MLQNNSVGNKAAQGWGKIRRFCLVHFAKNYVKLALSLRQGACSRCGSCCSIMFRCPHLKDHNECSIYEKRYEQCALFPIDDRDIKDCTCSHRFPPAIRDFRRSFFGLTPWGKREISLAGLSCTLLAMVLYLLHPWVIVFPAVLFGFVLFFFRDPVRIPPTDSPNAVLSPADGKLVEITRLETSPYTEGPCIRIGIVLSLFNVHINRAPLAGKVNKTVYTEGEFHNAFAQKSSEYNENNAIFMTPDLATDSTIIVKQISGAIARRIVCTCSKDDPLLSGQKLGMIKFGSRTELYLPENLEFESALKIGTKVQAGKTIMGNIKERKCDS